MDRLRPLRRATDLLTAFPVVALLGARQVGKTTLAAMIAAAWDGPTHRFDLEDPRAVARLADPMLALDGLSGLVILDEIQLRPSLFAVLRVLADRRPSPAAFLVLGSASPDLLRQGAETLAGRVAFMELDGFALDEVGPTRWRDLWIRGGFPRAFLDSERRSVTWRQQFIRTFVERDLPTLGVHVPPPTIRRFWSMLAHLHGQLWNGADLSRSFGVSEPTVRRYLDTLEGALAVRVLRPWHTNGGKRVVRSPRVYLSDPGILHTLLGLDDEAAVMGHPAAGASFEGFVFEQITQLAALEREDLYFWRTHNGAELDLLWARGNRRIGFEMKLTTAPSLTRSMHTALADLGLERLIVVHAGADAFPLAARVDAVPVQDLPDALGRLMAPGD